MFRLVVVGGTFDGLHEGHKRIIRAAFDIGSSVVIGLTSDEFAERFRTRKVSSYGSRRHALEVFVQDFNKRYDIVEINDSYGIATIDAEIDCIVVSEETLLRAEEINKIRFKKKLPKLTTVVVPLVLDERGQPLSTDDGG